LIFIIGNGPTMADVDLSRLDGETTLVFNDITHRFHEFQPTYWMFGDRTFYNNYRDELEEAVKKGTKLITSAYKKFSGSERLLVYGDSVLLWVKF